MDDVRGKPPSSEDETASGAGGGGGSGEESDDEEGEATDTDDEKPLSRSKKKKIKTIIAEKIERLKSKQEEKRKEKAKKDAARDNPDAFLGRQKVVAVSSSVYFVLNNSIHQKVPTTIRDRLILALPPPQPGTTYPDRKEWDILMQDPMSTLSRLLRELKKIPIHKNKTSKQVAQSMKESYRSYYRKVRS